MSSNEIADRLNHFGRNIERWRTEAARLTLLAAQAKEQKPDEAQLIDLEETATAVYEDIAEFQRTVEAVAAKSPAAAAELAPVSDAIHLVLLEITELGIRLYSSRTELPQLS
ncbi:hypothetical protein [Devosia sp. A16]|uniref:hypothetical protein n=1 Tax=Devosia sp. A16 TaxID=1736675 RepID=UPI0006D8130E|nr:hypothetical protein [Devosia sp. A16]